MSHHESSVDFWKCILVYLLLCCGKGSTFCRGHIWTITWESTWL